MRARVWPPRSANLPFRASSLSQENSPLTYPGAGPPEFRTSFGAGGARVLTESPPTPYSPRSPSFTSRPRAVPLTPPYRPACRPHRAVARATADKIHTQRTVGIFPFRKFLFFCVSYGMAERRPSDLSIAGQYACTTTKTKHVCSQ
jgi:hypothetical protein